MVDYYASGPACRSVPSWTFYEVFGLFRLAVIAQQIYYRYFHKQTTNKKYKEFHYVTLYLGWRCRRLVRPRRSAAGRDRARGVARGAGDTAIAANG